MTPRLEQFPPDATDSVLGPLLAARSIAIIGASENPLKPTGRTLRYLQMHGYRGTVYPVNPSRQTVQGLPCWPSVTDLPHTPDLAVIALPAPAVAAAVADCGAKGIPAAVVYSSGFAEVGGHGELLQSELAALAEQHRIRILGPNTNGVIGATGRVTATFMSGIDDPDLPLRDDGIAFVTQSGAMGGFIVRQAQLAGLGIGTFLATGNEMDLSLPELLELLVDDPGTRAVLAYVEGVRDPGRFRSALARAQERDVPVAVMKVGRSEVGAAAAATHTGAVAGSDTVVDGVLRQYRVARAHDVDHLLDLGRILALTPAPRGRRMSVVTLSGGAGVLVSDVAADLGIQVPRWEEEWADQLRQVLPPFAAVGNPIDTTGALVTDPTLLAGALEVMGRHPQTDVILVVVGNMQQQEDQVCDIIAEAAAATDTPVVTVWIGGSGTVPGRMAQRGLAAFSEPVRAVRAIAALMDRADLRGCEQTRDEDAVSDPQPTPQLIDEVTVKQALARYGVPTVPEEAVTTAAAAVDAAHRIGYPVVVKLLSAEVGHKSDLGLVKVGLPDAESVHDAATEILHDAHRHGVSDRRLVVQQLVAADTELILGMRRDPSFGPVIVLGVGGVLTEVLADVQVRVPPLTAADVAQMRSDLRFATLLDGPRGRPPVDHEALAETVLAFDRAVRAQADSWESVEINPLLIDGQGRPVAVDALATVRATAHRGDHHPDITIRTTTSEQEDG